MIRISPIGHGAPHAAPVAHASVSHAAAAAQAPTIHAALGLNGPGSQSVSRLGAASPAILPQPARPVRDTIARSESSAPLSIQQYAHLARGHESPYFL